MATDGRGGVQMGLGTASVSKQVAEVQRLLEQCEGVTFTMHSFGTTVGLFLGRCTEIIYGLEAMLTNINCVEGSWEDVTRAIGRAHQHLHDQGIPRVHTSIRIGTR